jgi:DNA-binding GntR family transcriptional regulator
MASSSSSRISSAELSPDVIPFPPEDGRKTAQKAQTLHHGVLSTLRDLIVHGELPPGTRLTETALCERLKVSRTPLREALKVLSHQGLAEILPNRGARVGRLMLEDVKNLFEVIATLESLAGRLACERITDAEICEVKALHYQMQASFIRRDLPEYFQLNQTIHRRIVAVAGNPVLAATHENLNARLLRARYLASQTDHERWAAAMHGHELIIDALSRRAGEEIGRILQEHLWHKYGTIRAHFEQV